MPISTIGRSNNGFTLVELVIVVLLLGLLASLSLPTLSSYEPDQLNSSARRISGTVKALYNEAALSGLEHRLVFDLSVGSYRGMRLERSGDLVPLTGPGRGGNLPEKVRFTRIEQPGSGEESRGEVTTRLSPGGWLQETLIELQDSRKRELNLRLVPLTGTTEIKQTRRESL